MTQAALFLNCNLIAWQHHTNVADFCLHQTRHDILSHFRLATSLFAIIQFYVYTFGRKIVDFCSSCYFQMICCTTESKCVGPIFLKSLRNGTFNMIMYTIVRVILYITSMQPSFQIIYFLQSTILLLFEFAAHERYKTFGICNPVCTDEAQQQIGFHKNCI